MARAWSQRIRSTSINEVHISKGARLKNQASCLCGSVAWEITAEPFQAFNCHCKLCRKAHGAAFGTYWFVLPDQFHWTSDTDTIVHYQSSHLLTRSFCGTCGSVVPYPSELRDQVLALGGCHDDGKEHIGQPSPPIANPEPVLFWRAFFDQPDDAQWDNKKDQHPV